MYFVRKNSTLISFELSKHYRSKNSTKLKNKYISISVFQSVFQLASNNCIRNFVTFQEVEVSKLGPMFLYRRAFIPARNWTWFTIITVDWGFIT